MKESPYSIKQCEHGLSFSKPCIKQYNTDLYKSMMPKGDMIEFDVVADDDYDTDYITNDVDNHNPEVSNFSQLTASTFCSMKMLMNQDIVACNDDDINIMISKSSLNKKQQEYSIKMMKLNINKKENHENSKPMMSLMDLNGFPNEMSLLTTTTIEGNKIGTLRKNINIDNANHTRTNATRAMTMMNTLQKQKLMNLPKKDHPMRHLVFNPKVSADVFKKHMESLSVDMVNTMKNIVDPLKNHHHSNTKKVRLNPLPKDIQKTIVLDLDETIVYCGEDNQKLGDNKDILYIKRRPYLHQFLRNMSKKYEIIVFTAAKSSYASLLVNELDPSHTMISCVLDRRHCFETKNGYYVKDLSIIENRDISNMLIVDNFIHSFAFQLDNGIPILEWKGDPYDQELKYLEKYLNELYEEKNIQQANKERLRLREIYQYSFDEFLLQRKKERSITTNSTLNEELSFFFFFSLSLV